MTGPGTNTYLVGDPGTGEWTVIDPGPDLELHRRSIQAAAGRIVRILVTHTHVDHSPGAAALARATGAPVWGRLPDHPGGQDSHFSPDHHPVDGERIELSARTHLRVLHTPGHASNHLCFLLEEEALLFTGDHLMSGSTVVINPPDGDMKAHLQSLRRLLDEPLRWLAPGHGFLVAQPHEVISALIAHRLRREDKVRLALRAAGRGTLDSLVLKAYDDTPASLHPVARRSLLAHLLKLESDGEARRDGEDWTPA